MAPSQLAQLKAALSSGGLNRKSQSKKSKKSGGKKGGAQDVDRAKKMAKLDEIRARFNKFDERETRTKHDVGGRNLKGVTGRPTAARSAGLEQRRQTLLDEHHLRDHRGTFRDRRFGENDPSMSLEDRMLERYTRERQRGQGKKGMFNLEDDDEFGDDEDGFALGLTHGGRNVMDLPGDDFEMMGMGEEDEESGAIGRQRVSREHFGGFRDDEEGEEEGERKKTKHEVMSEIIAKSKDYKLERQKMRDEDEEMRAELDGGLDELRELLAGSVPVKPKVQLPGPERAAPMADQVDDKDYDQFVRSLAFEARAKPKDRTKTEEEEAADEKARLEEAEAKRLRRMRGEESEEEEGGKRRKERAPDADDLGDDFEGDVDEEGNVLLGEGLTRKAIEGMAPSRSGEGSGDEEESGEEGDEDDDDDEDEDEDDEEHDDDESVSELEDLDSDEASDDEAPQLVPTTRKRKALVSEIPYTFPCPATLSEFEEIVAPLADSAVPTVVQRIRALHHPSLAQGNKERLQDFLGVLLDYMLVLASEERFDTITALGPHLAALVKLNPLTASSHFITKLVVMQKNLAKGLARGASNPTSKTMPGAPELTLLRLVGATWSTSDYSHPVAQPAMLLMGQYLSQSRIRSTADLASGLFLCSLVAQYEAESRRLVPEAVNFLASAILALLKRKKDAVPVRAFPNLVAAELFLGVGVAPHHPVNPLSARADGEQARSNLLAASLRLIQSYASAYSGLDAFAELFAPLFSVLASSRVSKLVPALKSLFAQTTGQLENQLRLATDTRAPLALQDHKPIPIASYAPRFEDDFAPGRHYDPDVERNAAAKLRAEYKKERKGAIRELRKDNRFLASERAREQAEKDAEYSAKMRRAHGSLNAERAEEKEMEREKRREKRRRGN